MIKKNIAISNNKIKIANAGLDNDIPILSTSETLLNNDDKYLYANLKDLNSDFQQKVAQSNLPVAEFMKHNLIVNNYELLNSSTNTDLKFNYKINDTNRSAANTLKIYDIKYDIDTSDANTNLFNPTTNPYLNIKTDENRKRITEINRGTTENNITTNHNVIPVTCDRVYPLYLATKDIELSKENNKIDQNVLRCAYSKVCGVPWTDINCDKYHLN